jgi:hypothetical protein
MTELAFLGLAAVAGAFKLTAIAIGVIWAFQSLSMREAPLIYRRSRTRLPFRSARRGN